jgi:hypothetical protein
MPIKRTGGLVAAAVLAGSLWAPAAATADPGVVTPVMDCSAVTGLDLTGVTDAPVTIRSATVSTAGAPAPYCAVVGTIAPADTIVMRLPIQGWTLRYLQYYETMRDVMGGRAVDGRLVCDPGRLKL